MRRWSLLLWVLLVACWAYSVPGAEPPKQKAPPEDYYRLFKVLVDCLDQVERNYVKKVDRRELVEAAIQGMLTKLDPYSSYINPDELGRFRAGMESEFGGIGVQITVDGGHLRVLSPLVDTPAYRAGVIAGDRIVEVDGQSTEGITIDKAVQRLKGPPGTKVTIKVLHPGATEPETMTVTRELVHVETVLGYQRLPNDRWDYLLDHQKRIGYVRLVACSRDTARDLRKVVEQLQAAKLRGLILDLRFNPGGLLTSAIEVSDLFVSKGRIVSTAGRNSPERVWEAHAKDTLEGFPMAVLVNRFSASASEIVAACLQDHKRALVVGERTWGKGSVQNVIELEEGSSLLKLTTSSYLRPSGKNIDRASAAKDDDPWGVTPDKGYELKLSDQDLLAQIQDRRQRDVVQPHTPAPATKPAGETPAAGSKPAGKPAKGASKSDPKKSGGPFVDRQLQMAVDYLTAELARAGNE